MKNQKRALRRHHAERIRRKIARQFFVYRGMFDNRLWATPERLAEYLKWREGHRRYWQGRLLQTRTLCSAFCCGNRRWEGLSYSELKRKIPFNRLANPGIEMYGDD
jgi:phosphatidylinositol kinase/protein kinase (PI-3  family)